MNVRKVFVGIIIAVFLTLLYSHNLLDVPTGLTVDEAAFGYNATLLAQTGRDQNGRFLPIFVLSTNGTDWRQPITQYYLAGLFKVFGPSVYLLRFSSVVIAILSVFGTYFLARKLLSEKAALFAGLFVALTPLIMIQAHMGLDNIMPIPFTIIWLFGLLNYQGKRGTKWLVVSALALGLSFYSYKGMRAIVPVWIILTALWLKKDRIIFLSFLTPFFLVIPLLEHYYAGAILGGSSPGVNDIYDFLSPYLSSFDVSYLFIRGDITDFHSTGRHGMLLLASLPVIVLGIYAAAKSKNGFIRFSLLALLLGPILYGTVGSTHRFSRLMALIPLYGLLAGLGLEYLSAQKSKWNKLVLPILVALFFVNFVDYYKFYLTQYPPITFNLLGDLQNFRDIERFAKEARARNLTPYLEEQISTGGGESIKFFQTIYFGKLLPTAEDNLATPKGTILLTNRKEIPNMKEIENVDRVQYYIQIGIL